MIKQKYEDYFLDIGSVLDIFDPNTIIQELLESALKRLRRIVKETDAKIVIISNWRYGSKNTQIA